MKTSMLRSVSLLALASCALAASAQNSFYGGDFDGRNALSSERNTAVSDSRVYDDFTLGSTTNVQSLFGNFLVNGTFSSLYYEIRQGVSSGNGGALLFSGNLAATTVDSGTDAFGLDLVRISGSPVGITLGAGTYFLSVAAVDGGAGRAYLATTIGSNGVGGPLNDQNSFIDSAFFGRVFAPTSSELGYTADFSLGLTGTAATSAVPGPMAALPFALMALKRRKRA